MTSLIAAAPATTRRNGKAGSAASYLIGCAFFLAAVVGLFSLAGF
ncbi:MAG: hypothetical protein NTW56_09590 [Alphaproteobacteria bacterium]|nr:hypothetical protein [Alphaproteobacteria bacterium]